VASARGGFSTVASARAGFSTVASGAAFADRTNSEAESLLSAIHPTH
jgi:hypothetical protein